MAEVGAPAVQGGGGDAEDTAASQHRALLRLLRGDAVSPRQARHCARHRTDDVRHAQDVRTASLFFAVTSLSITATHV